MDIVKKFNQKVDIYAIALTGEPGEEKPDLELKEFEGRILTIYNPDSGKFMDIKFRELDSVNSEKNGSEYSANYAVYSGYAVEGNLPSEGLFLRNTTAEILVPERCCLRVCVIDFSVNGMTDFHISAQVKVGNQEDTV